MTDLVPHSKWLNRVFLEALRKHDIATAAQTLATLFKLHFLPTVGPHLMDYGIALIKCVEEQGVQHNVIKQYLQKLVNLGGESEVMRARSRALATILVSEGSIAESEALIKNRLEKGLVKEELAWLDNLCNERTTANTNYSLPATPCNEAGERTIADSVAANTDTRLLIDVISNVGIGS